MEKSKVKALVIAHNCVLASAQERLVELAKFNDIELSLLVPPRNLESHGMIELEKTHDPNYGIIRGKPLLSQIAGQRYLQFYPFLTTLLLRLKPDVIDIHEEPWSLTGFQAIFLRNVFLKSCRVIIETEQNIHKDFPFPFSHFERYALRHSDIVIARNEEARRVIRNKGFSGPIPILPNGLDKTIFKPVDAAAAREHLQLNNFTVGYMGRMEAEKGLDDLLRAVASSGHVMDLLMVGEGKHLAELQLLAASLRFQGRVVWHPPVPQSRVPLLLSCMDTLVLPSRTTPTWKEQFGRVIVEAMACGVPVVGSDSGAIPEVIGDAGIVFPEGNIDSLRIALDGIYSHKEMRDKFIRRGMELVDGRYSWACVAARLHEMFTLPPKMISENTVT